MKLSELTIKFKASVGVILRSLAHFLRNRFADLNSGYVLLSSSINDIKSSLLKTLDFKKLSNLAVSLGFSLTHSIKRLSKVSWVKLRSFTLFSKKSLVLISTLFIKYTKKSFLAIKTWYFRRFKAYRGIAIVCGLEYRPQIGEVVKALINDYNFRYTFLSDPVTAMNDKTSDFMPLFFNSLTKEEMTRLNKVRDALLTQTNPTLHHSINLIRVHLGRLFLLKKQFNPKLFTVFFYILTPDEVRFLKQQGYYLLYLQSMNPAYITEYDRGYTFGSQRFDKYIFPDDKKGLSIGYLEELFKNIITGVTHR